METQAFCIDECGRGCLWGPVVAATVVLPPTCPESNPLWNKIRDSKKVSEKQMPILAAYIKRIALTYGVGYVSAADVDRYNILQATMRAMHLALDQAWNRWDVEAASGPHPSMIWVDGNTFNPYMPPLLPGADAREAEFMEFELFPHGDANVHGIAAASIVAKADRDAWVVAQAAEDPTLAPYQLNKNKGYGTAVHMRALRDVGPHALHRYSFAPVRAAAASSDLV